VEELTVSAGDGVLFSPFLVHGSVANRSDRVKLVMLVQIQDLSTMFDPDDASDEIGRQMRAIHAVRAAAEATGNGIDGSS
jgi:ectoine hydroxylase-related dioxygenase (phytanoyl-CoA dioxygenase family)